MKAFLRCIAIATEQEKDKIWVQKRFLRQILQTQDEFYCKSNATKVIEGNHYFPPNSISTEFFKPSDTHSTCPWKGVASHYTLEVDGKQNTDAAWYYPETSELAKQIKGYVAFWKGVAIEE